MRYVTAAGVVGIPSLWWLANTRDDATREDAPYIEDPPAEHWSVEPGPSRDQVTRIISQGAYSFLARDVAGVSRYDGAQLASNSPCEDQFTYGILPSPWKGGNKWMAWAVFDGHSGLQTSELLKKQLLPFVRHSLSQIQPTSTESPVPDELVQRAIIKGFLNLDDSIVKTALITSQGQESLQEKVKNWPPLIPAHAPCSLCTILQPVHYMWRVPVIRGRFWGSKSQTVNGKQCHCQ